MRSKQFYQFQKKCLVAFFKCSFYFIFMQFICFWFLSLGFIHTLRCAVPISFYSIWQALFGWLNAKVHWCGHHIYFTLFLFLFDTPTAISIFIVSLALYHSFQHSPLAKAIEMHVPTQMIMHIIQYSKMEYIYYNISIYCCLQFSMDTAAI